MISQINVTNVLQLIRTMEITQEITEEIRDKRWNRTIREYGETALRTLRYLTSVVNWTKHFVICLTVRMSNYLRIAARTGTLWGLVSTEIHFKTLRPLFNLFRFCTTKVVTTLKAERIGLSCRVKISLQMVSQNGILILNWFLQFVLKQ